MTRTPLAWRNLTHHKVRAAVAVAGVAFALILVFMQLGFFGSVRATATLIYDRLRFDVLLVSSQYLDVHRPRTFPQDRLYQARTAPGVAAAYPVGVGYQRWRNPERPDRRRSIMMVAFDPAEPVWRFETFGRAERAPETFARLREPETAVIDTRTRRDFGPQDVGTVTELGTSRVEVVGRVTIGTGFGADGLILVDHRLYREALGLDPREHVSLGLLQLEPGADVASVVADLRSRLPADVQVFGREELRARESRHWVRNTSVGIIFTIGVGVAFVVGVVFVYQVMAGDIANRLHEYATLKAVGYPDVYLTRVVLRQAAYLALLGYVPGLLTAMGLYALTRSVAAIPMDMDPTTAVAVLVMALVMCGASGLLALRKAKAADPADLF